MLLVDHLVEDEGARGLVSWGDVVDVMRVDVRGSLKVDMGCGWVWNWEG